MPIRRLPSSHRRPGLFDEVRACRKLERGRQLVADFGAVGDHGESSIYAPPGGWRLTVFNLSLVGSHSARGSPQSLSLSVPSPLFKILVCTVCLEASHW